MSAVLGEEWTMRLATVDDAPVIAAIHVQGWRDSYAGLVDQTYLDSLTEDECMAKWRGWLRDGAQVQLAFEAGAAAAGFVSYGKLRTPIPGQSPIRPLYVGEIYALYILPAFWRRGLGRQLMAAGAHDLAAMKHRSLCLWVLDGNRRAVEFYKALGGQRCGSKETEIGAQRKKELCFGWRDSGILER